MRVRPLRQNSAPGSAQHSSPWRSGLLLADLHAEARRPAGGKPREVSARDAIAAVKASEQRSLTRDDLVRHGGSANWHRCLRRRAAQWPADKAGHTGAEPVTRCCYGKGMHGAAGERCVPNTTAIELTFPVAVVIQTWSPDGSLLVSIEKRTLPSWLTST